MSRSKGTLHMLCGKIAAGKSTLSDELGKAENTVVISEDRWIAQLYPSEIKGLGDYFERSERLRVTLAPHIVDLLRVGVSVVLDFPANTKRQRAWFRQLIEMSGSDHELHFIVASDELCKRQLKQRSQELGLPPGTKWTTEADFDEITAYFDPPAADEHFNVIRHERHE